MTSVFSFEKAENGFVIQQMGSDGISYRHQRTFVARNAAEMWQIIDDALRAEAKAAYERKRAIMEAHSRKESVPIHERASPVVRDPLAVDRPAQQGGNTEQQAKDGGEG